MVKKQVSWTINEDLVQRIKTDSINKERSESWIVNKIFKDYYDKKEGN